MSCAHCVKRVYEALNEIEGLKVKVNLKKGHAIIKSNMDIKDQDIQEKVENAGYKVLSIRDK